MPPYCIVTWPPSSAFSAGPEPLNGTWMILVPAWRFTITPTRWVEAPMPPEAKLSSVFLASAISSCRFLAGTSGWTIRITGPCATMVTALKSFSVS